MTTPEQEALAERWVQELSGDYYTLLQEARERYAAHRSVRGMAKPSDAPPDAWWSIQRRPRGGVYLYLRWRDFGRLRARSLGRLDNGA